MSVINAIPLLAAAGGDYTISRSVRLRSSASAYFNRTPASAGNRKTWTFSFWHKRGAIADCIVFGSRNAGTTTVGYIGFQSDKFDFQFGATGNRIQDAAVRRDPSAWAHFHVVCDTTNATSTERMQLWVNGVRVTSFSQTSYPTQNADSDFNVADFHAIGRYGASASNYVDGYLTEINFIDGQALTPSSFGETDSITGVWKPKKYAGTYGTNGFYLNFSDNSNNTATTIGKDYSGNGNNWTPNNISVTSGSTYDSMLDVPTPYADGGNGRGNYAVLNPLDQHGTSAYATVADGNLYWYGSYNTQNGHGIRSTLRVPPTGKWYVEASNVTYSGSGNSCMLGFTSSTQPITNSAFGGTLTPWIGVDASVFNNTVSLSSNGASASPSSGTLFASCASGDIINLAIDFDAGKFWVGKNGTWYNSGDPAAGTNATSTFTAGSAEWTFWAEYVAASTNTNRSSAVANFGQRPFAYTPPSGFKALNTQNLPEPTIKNGKQNFDVLTYAGSASSQTISGLNFQPDLIWFKERTTAGIDHFLVDSVRSSYGLRLYSNSTAAEASTAAVTSVTSTGYTLAGGGSNTNDAFGRTYVTWNWKAGGSSSSNTSGSITSTVSANTTAGFSVVTYTGIAGNVAKTFGHGLGVAPSMVIVKGRDAGSTGVNDWVVWHSAFTGSEYIYLDLTNAKGTSANYWGATVPSSTVVTVGGNSSNVSNESGIKYVAYCFSAVRGYSAFGSYTGNGSSDGPFVYTGFRPRYVMIKRIDAAGFSWTIEDSSRSPYNASDKILYANLSDAENTGTARNDFLSNGFKARDSGNNNVSGGTYIYAAFAENPFKLSLAR